MDKPPTRKSKNQELAEFFHARPNVWIDGRSLEFAGRYAWRTRVSNLRAAPFSMTIENRVRVVADHPNERNPAEFAEFQTNGSLKYFKISEYRYVPPPMPDDSRHMTTETLSRDNQQAEAQQEGRLF